MRHRKASRRLGRPAGPRTSMFRNLVRSLFVHQRLKTTLAKAKETGRLADRLITLGKRGDLHAQRQANAFLNDRELTSILFRQIAPRFRNRSGGYTRIIHIGNRSGDGAQMVVLELTEQEPKERLKSAKERPQKIEGKIPPKETPKLPRQEPKPAKEKPKGFLEGLRGFFKKEGGR